MYLVWNQWQPYFHCFFVFLFRLKSRFECSQFCPPNLNPIESENTAFIKRTLWFSAFSCSTPYSIGISEVVLRLLLIAVAFYTPRGACLFASGPQIPTGGFGLEHISTHNCSFALLRLPKPCSGFPSPFRRSNHLTWPTKTTEASAWWRKS